MTDIKPDQDKWERSPGYIYFIAAGNPTQAIKIGITIQEGLRNRLRSHQSSNHEALKILRLILFSEQERPMVAAQSMEQQLHRKYSHLQRFESGWVGSEWFTATPELLNDIASLGITPQDAGEIESLAKVAQGMYINA